MNTSAAEKQASNRRDGSFLLILVLFATILAPPFQPRNGPRKQLAVASLKEMQKG